MPRILETLAGLWPRRATTAAAAAAAADEAKASATGPLIVLETLGRPVWTPRDYEAFAREGFMQNAIVGPPQAPLPRAPARLALRARLAAPRRCNSEARPRAGRRTCFRFPPT